MTSARLRISILALWLVASAILLVVARAHIASLTMWDPDDYLRLQQIRDWLGGQSFFDVTQYRIDPPHGIPMHWSRIVDLPIATLIVALRPLLGPVVAERIAISVVPLLLFGGTLSAIAFNAARLAADRRVALLAAMLAAATPLILFQIMPLRIDHHGWQTMLGLFTIAAVFDPNARRGGLIAGACAAAWLAVSLEAMPMVVAVAALLALRFVLEGAAAATRFQAFAGALAVAGLALFATLHGRAAWSFYACDAVSPAWFGPMALAPAIAAIGVPFAARRGVAVRIGLLAVAGALGAGLLVATAPDCLRGPFGQLDPVVRKIWYENVLEGMPVWRQPLDTIVVLVGFPLIGLAGTLLGWRRASDAAARRDWLAMLALALAAFALSMMVQRAGAFAQGCALPGAALLLAGLLDAIGRWRRVLLRVLASAGTILALSPVGAAVIGSLALSPLDTSGETLAAAPVCAAPCDHFAAIAALPPAYVLAALDMTPHLLVTTPHRYAGSGYHRDPAAIRRVIDAFMGSPDTARRIMAARGMDYVLIDPTAEEPTIYHKAAPHGLMALLLADKAPAWLKPVPLKGSTFRMWRRMD